MEKFKILDDIWNLIQATKNNNLIDNFNQEKKKITKEFEETKDKAQYFLKQAKTNILTITNNLRTKVVDESKVRNVFLPFYSFSGKLKILGKNTKAEEYKAIATSLMNNDADSLSQRFNILQNIMQMDENINFYLKN